MKLTEWFRSHRERRRKKADPPRPLTLTGEETPPPETRYTEEYRAYLESDPAPERGPAPTEEPAEPEETAEAEEPAEPEEAPEPEETEEPEEPEETEEPEEP